MATVQRNSLQLRKTSQADLDSLFLFQLDEEYNHMAAFTAQDHSDRAAYLEKWTRLIADPSISMQTIYSDGQLVGSVLIWVMDGEPQIAYGVGKPYWGRGIATEALGLFLELESTRPLYGRVAFDNPPSQRVLEKCGFVKTGTERGFANARQEEIEEFVYILDS
jgi:[ribosomal protein S5]-alanine N-acetyltransferase